jgi:hypothetical protein
VSLQDPPDGGGADAMAELAQFAVDALVAPGLVLCGQPVNRRGDRVADDRATGAVHEGPAGDGSMPELVRIFQTVDAPIR